MRIACWIIKATDIHSEYVILLFHCNSSCMKAPQCYVIRTLPEWFHIIFTTTDPDYTVKLTRHKTYVSLRLNLLAHKSIQRIICGYVSEISKKEIVLIFLLPSDKITNRPTRFCADTTCSLQSIRRKNSYILFKILYTERDFTTLIKCPERLTGLSC